MYYGDVAEAYAVVFDSMLECGCVGQWLSRCAVAIT